MQREVTSGYLPESSWKVTGSVNIWILIYVEYNQQVIRRIGLQKKIQPAQMISCHR